MADTHDFPPALRAAQIELHQVTAELAALTDRLPWSVVPLPGWNEPHRWYRTECPDSPGWTDEEQDTVDTLRGRARELSILISTDPFWETVEKESVVEARMALKHAHEKAADDWAAA
ncbi:hypothetical protein [Streptomyces syringium]|uniref:hypothetical protein n=1 Tax=Streptomyces syringium TaxID=76729 RepID=UPI003AAF66D1